jgi:hypothetical protein
LQNPCYALLGSFVGTSKQKKVIPLTTFTVVRCNAVPMLIKAPLLSIGIAPPHPQGLR